MKHTTSVRQGLLTFAAFAFIGFGITACGDPGDPGSGNETYAITIKDGGTGFSASPATAKKGTKVTLKAGEKEGYGFIKWTSVKPAGLTIAADNTFTMPEAAVEVTATWELGAKNITVNQGNGSGSYASENSAKKGVKITLTEGTYDGYRFDGWTVIKPEDGLTIGADHTFTMPAADVEVTATWKLNPRVVITSNHILTAQGLELAFAATVTPQSVPLEVTWSVAGNEKTRFDGKILKVAADATPSEITVKVAVNGYEQQSTDERTLTILQSTANSAGSAWTAAIKSNGTLWVWGYNRQGLGNNSTTNSSVPVQVSGGGTWISVSAGGEHTAAIKSDGTLWSWGDNNYGQLGDNLKTSSRVPVQVFGNGTWVSVSAGGDHTTAIKSDGTLWAWGKNWYGQLGDNSISSRMVPVQEDSKSTWVSVSASSNHTAAIKSNGTLWAWGGNEYGQLGDNSNTGSRIPVQENNESTMWVSVSAAHSHTATIKSDGTLWLWGSNKEGQLGTSGASNIPLQERSKSTTWVSVSVGGEYTAAIKSNGTLWTWGNNNDGQLGNGGFYGDHIQVDSNPAPWASVSTSLSIFSHTVAIKSDGTLWAWGRNSDGQLGNESTDSKIHIPVQEKDKLTTWRVYLAK
ncbi:MAG: hypothetical protein FWD91_03265 [Treponema sp.]|nr:hypothetical protein [Treponema sp.]